MAFLLPELWFPARKKRGDGNVPDFEKCELIFLLMRRVSLKN
jgi:hypothetical protein